MRLLAFSLIIASFTATACPDLAGTYANCRSTTGRNASSDMVITQSENDGVTTYVITSTDDETNEPIEEIVVADGVARTQTEESEMGTLTITEVTTCSADKVIFSGTMALQGQTVANINMQFYKDGKTLNNMISGEIFGQTAEDTVICE